MITFTKCHIINVLSGLTKSRIAGALRKASKRRIDDMRIKFLMARMTHAAMKTLKTSYLLVSLTRKQIDIAAIVIMMFNALI